ncbi:MAG: methylmalonyl Co-A mutase-associated GTPase MeaB, partial [Eudoraea sp.]|nr:methylmalonyl Co-A mutase-associated GTPase MeaB [Eudoraea sp.]
MSKVTHLLHQRTPVPSAEELILGIDQGDTTSLARAITLVESENPDHLSKAARVIESCLKARPDTMRIGITGVPGVGKSTFIETLGVTLIEAGHRVAVLAIDPTSTLSKGSILGDKTRMTTLASNPNAFIRPSASGDSLGGVARKTREAIILCEA